MARSSVSDHKKQHLEFLTAFLRTMANCYFIKPKGMQHCYIPFFMLLISRALNFGEAVRPEKVDMFSRIGGRPTGIKVRSPLAWAASAEDNKADEAD
jgi:hypothetical protein